MPMASHFHSNQPHAKNHTIFENSSGKWPTVDPLFTCLIKLMLSVSIYSAIKRTPMLPENLHGKLLFLEEI